MKYRNRMITKTEYYTVSAEFSFLTKHLKNCQRILGFNRFNSFWCVFGYTHYFGYGLRP